MTKRGKTRNHRGTRGRPSKEERDAERLESKRPCSHCPVCGESNMYFMGTCQNCMMSEDPTKEK